jgi:hypothetical protein
MEMYYTTGGGGLKFVAFGIMSQGIYQHLDVRHSAYFEDDKRKAPHVLL